MRWSSRLSSLAVRAAFLACIFAVCAAPSQRSASTSASPGPQTATNPSQAQFFVLIDPSHGGEDKGAVFSARLMEKDVTLSLARALRKELEEHDIPVRLLRESDVTVSLEHRAELCNQQRPSLYIALHAGMPGTGVRVYTTALPSRQQPVGSFVPWDSAQAASLQRSAAIARAVTQELRKKDLKASNLQAFLRPLNNVITPAIAIEVAAASTDLHALENSKLQETVASAVGSALEEDRIPAGGAR